MFRITDNTTLNHREYLVTDVNDVYDIVIGISGGDWRMAIDALKCVSDMSFGDTKAFPCCFIECIREDRDVGEPIAIRIVMNTESDTKFFVKRYLNGEEEVHLDAFFTIDKENELHDWVKRLIEQRQVTVEIPIDYFMKNQGKKCEGYDDYKKAMGLSLDNFAHLMPEWMRQISEGNRSEQGL